MPHPSVSAICELYGQPTTATTIDWPAVVSEQHCPYLRRKCLKVRKSEPDQTIGTCSVRYGRERRSVIICPYRMLERNQVFLDCVHLLSRHEPGNELHVVPEITVPGGSVDYVLVSARRRRVEDFVGVEFQTLDTTGTIWPERQRFLEAVGMPVGEAVTETGRSFGMNWKMTAKTALVQLNHKIGTFEDLNRHLVLAVQDCLFTYMSESFRFAHLRPARPGDSMHFHTYSHAPAGDARFRIEMSDRLSTDADGVATCLGLQADPRVELAEIVAALEAKLEDETLLALA